MTFNAADRVGVVGGYIGGIGQILNMLGGGVINGNCNAACGNNAYINRYELGLEQANAAKDAEISTLKSTIHTDGKILEVYENLDGRLRGIEGQLAQQAVVNAQVTANISCMQGNIANLMSLTKTIVPIDNVCPQPMPQYNSWTAPTA